MVMFLLQGLIKNTGGMGFVQPSGMVRGTFSGQKQPAAHCGALCQGTDNQAFSIKVRARQYFSSFLLPESGKFSPRLTCSMESFKLRNLNRVF